MNVPILLGEFDWSQVFYFLIPLVYVAMQFFGGSKEKKPRQDSAEKPATSDAQEHLRKVREEIRRKVAERQEQVRRVVEGGEEKPGEGTFQRQDPTGYDPSLPEWMQRRESRPTASPTLERRSRPDPEPTPAPPPVPQEDPLDRQLREQRERLAKTRRAREAAFAKARKIAQEKPVPGGGRSIFTVGSTRGQVLAALGSPNAARTAIVLSEVLGPPKSMRPLDERL